MNTLRLTSIFSVLLWLLAMGHCFAECRNFDSQHAGSLPCHQHEQESGSDQCCNDNCQVQAYNPSETWKKIAADNFVFLDSIVFSAKSVAIVDGEALFTTVHLIPPRSAGIQSRDFASALIVAPNAPPVFA